MASKFFIDTGAYFARFYARDRHHSVSLDIWNRLENEGIIAFTTNHVIDELATLLARHTSYEFSAIKLEGIYQSEDTWIERPSEKDERQALAFFKKFADQKISFTDCLSFVTMKKIPVNQVFTFDRHFQYAGFRLIPD